MADDAIIPLLGIDMQPDGDGDSSDSNNDENAGEESDMEEGNEMMEVDKKKGQKDRSESQKDPTKSFSFDESLPSSHTYLGTDLQEISGRTILEEDSVIELPLITLPGTILVPGHIIPLYCHNQHEVAMLKTVVDSSQKTFGVVTLRYNDNFRHSVAGIGTTAEIYSVKSEMDESSGIATISVLALGRQRFELKDYKRTITGVLLGKVKILPEIDLASALDSIRSPTHKKFCYHQGDKEEDVKVAVDRQGRILSCVRMKPRSKVNRFSSAYLSWWPPWVYQMYDKEFLVKRIKTELQKWNDTLRPEKMPDDATKLSYWVTQNIPLDDTLKLHLLSINSTIQRLRCALGIICKCTILCCKECQQQITDMSNVFSMSVAGPLSAYVNPGGHVHETVTVHKAQNLNLLGRPSTEHSWFPGYAWTIAQCRRCSNHMGWKFSTKNKDLTPKKFWGLCRSSMAPGISEVNQEEESNWMPVM